MPESQTPDANQDTGSDQDRKPWGDDSEFDPQKAWTLIQNLRAEIAEGKTKHQDQIAAKDAELSNKDAELSAKLEEIETIKASAQSSVDALAAKEAELTTLQALRTKENLLLGAGIPAAFAANLTGDDEEAWKADIARLAELRGGAPQNYTPDPAQAAGNENDVDPQAEAAAFFEANMNR